MAHTSMVEWRFGDHLRVVKNPLFWDAKSVCVDQADYYPTVDTDRRRNGGCGGASWTRRHPARPTGSPS